MNIKTTRSMKIKLETKQRKLCQEAERYVLTEIRKICRRFKWSMSSGHGITVWRNGLNGDKIEHDTRVHRLIYWYEETFERFGFYCIKNGEFIDGQTPLMKMSKPNL